MPKKPDVDALVPLADRLETTIALNAKNGDIVFMFSCHDGHFAGQTVAVPYTREQAEKMVAALRNALRGGLPIPGEGVVH